MRMVEGSVNTAIIIQFYRASSVGYDGNQRRDAGKWRLRDDGERERRATIQREIHSSVKSVSVCLGGEHDPGCEGVTRPRPP